VWGIFRRTIQDMAKIFIGEPFLGIFEVTIAHERQSIQEFSRSGLLPITFRLRDEIAAQEHLKKASAT